MCLYVWLVNMVWVSSSFLLLSFFLSFSVWKWIIHHCSSEWQKRNPFMEHYTFSLSSLLKGSTGRVRDGENEEEEDGGRGEGEVKVEEESEWVCDWFVCIRVILFLSLLFLLLSGFLDPSFNVLPFDTQSSGSNRNESERKEREREREKERHSLNETSFYRCYIINYILIQQ